MRLYGAIQAVTGYLGAWQIPLSGLGQGSTVLEKGSLQPGSSIAQQLAAIHGMKRAFVDDLVPSITIRGHNPRLNPQNKSHYTSLQKLNLEKSRLKIPFIQFGEYLHGVGSFNQSMFSQSIRLSASFDTGLVRRVGRAIGSEARAIGIHACLSPVLDLGLEVRWGRLQEAWGEDMLLTSHMGVEMASGLSRNGSWSDPDAVVPVMKHFAAHGSPQGGTNAAPATLRGKRQLMMSMMRLFKAAIDLGGVRGLMMAYNELDDVPAHVNQMLYETLSKWGFDGFVTADDTGMAELLTRHRVASSSADAIAQWFDAGGMIQYYDFPLEVLLAATIDLVKDGSVSRLTLESHVRKILDFKYDLGLFENPYIAEYVNPKALTAAHAPLVLEAAHKSIVLLKNRNKTLPLSPERQDLSKIELIGPSLDTCNNGDYSGQWGSTCGQHPTKRQAMSAHLAANHPNVSLTSSWEANAWMYSAQYQIPAYLLSSKGVPGGLMATYFADTNFEEAVVSRQEVPNRDWGLHLPAGLSSNNFSVIRESEINSPIHSNVDGWLGISTSANMTARLYIEDELMVHSEKSRASKILSNIKPFGYSMLNATQAPPGSVPFTFSPGASYKVMLELQVWNYEAKVENIQSEGSSRTLLESG